MKMRAISLTLFSIFLAACGGGSSSAPTVGSAACSIDGQKTFVLDAMRDVYFWNDLLPSSVNLTAYDTPESLLEFLITVQPLDRFSYIDSAAADAAFFGEGQFVGFGFSSTLTSTGDVRFLRVFGGSPADLGGLARGQRLVAVDGRAVADILANEGLSEAFGPSEEGVVRTLTIEENGVQFETMLTKAVVTIDPVPQVLTFDINNVTYGYIEFQTFISTANAKLDDAFEQFRNAGITGVILDLRYNGGGLVSVAENTGDYLGGATATNEIFSETLYNANNAGSNRIRRFQRLASSINLSELVVLTTGATASASELVINGLEPFASVRLVGDDTFGKPVGQVGIEFCEKILRATAFETVNGLGEGGFFDGLPVDCTAEDNLSTVVGSQQDPMVSTALSLLSTGACPPPPINGKTRPDPLRYEMLPPKTVAQEHAYAF